MVEDKAMPVKDCARLIIYAMVRRRREVVMTAQGKVGRWLKLISGLVMVGLGVYLIVWP